MNWSSAENIDITYRLLNLRGFGPAKANRFLWSIGSRINSTIQYEEEIRKLLSPTDAQMFMSPSDIWREKDTNTHFVSVLDDLYPLTLLNKILRQYWLIGVT